MIVSGILNSGCERSGGLVRKIGQKRLNCRPAIFTKKSQKIRETYGFTDFSGGPNRDRTDDLTDANRTLSRTRHSTGPTLLAKQGFLPALLGPVYCAGFLGDANHWEEASE